MSVDNTRVQAGLAAAKMLGSMANIALPIDEAFAAFAAGKEFLGLGKEVWAALAPVVSEDQMAQIVANRQAQMEAARADDLRGQPITGNQ